VIALQDAGGGHLAAQVAFNTADSTDSSASSPDGGCQGFGGAGARDEVFTVAITQPVPSLTAWLVPFPDGGLATGTPMIYARSSCADPASELACGFAFDTSDGGAWIRTGGLDAGSYFIWVDGVPGGPGLLNLTVP
jgi:hypothetical protein